jgi:thiamine transport system permease protein
MASRLVALIVLAAVLGPLVPLLLAGGIGRPTPQHWAAVRFTVVQAALSAALSVALAVPVARALARRRFAGRDLLVTALGAPFLLPSVVAVIGLLAVFGRSGWVSDGLGLLGLPPVQVYGLHGVVLAHVFLNLPLCLRLILQGWQAIPAERFRLAEGLGFAPADVVRHLERPMLREVLPGAALTVLALCLTSFAVALTLGGGPRATTVELAIYQALRFDFDLPAAARLALVQVALSGLAFALALRLTRAAGFGAGLDRAGGPPAPGGWRRWTDGLWIGGAALFLALPLAAVAAHGLPALPALPPEVWEAAARSLAMALVSVALVLALALPLVLGRGVVPALAGTLPLALSPLALGTGLFLLLVPLAPAPVLALPVTVAVNALLALPLAVRILTPAARAAEAGHGRLATSLGLTGAARLRLVILPRLRRPLGFAAGLTAALAVGDLGVIALFATDSPTLPLQVQRLMGAYRMDQAAGAALLLLVLGLGLFALFERGGRRVDA